MKEIILSIHCTGSCPERRYGNALSIIHFCSYILSFLICRNLGTLDRFVIENGTIASFHADALSGVSIEKVANPTHSYPVRQVKKLRTKPYTTPLLLDAKLLLLLIFQFQHFVDRLIRCSCDGCCSNVNRNSHLVFKYFITDYHLIAELKVYLGHFFNQKQTSQENFNFGRNTNGVHKF